MGKFEKAKQEFAKLDDEEKVIALFVGVALIFVAILLAFLLVALAKELFVPALIAVAIYSAGVKWFGWPIPKFVKKLFK